MKKTSRTAKRQTRPPSRRCPRWGDLARAGRPDGVLENSAPGDLCGVAPAPPPSIWGLQHARSPFAPPAPSRRRRCTAAPRAAVRTPACFPGPEVAVSRAGAREHGRLPQLLTCAVAAGARVQPDRLQRAHQPAGAAAPGRTREPGRAGLLPAPCAPQRASRARMFRVPAWARPTATALVGARLLGFAAVRRARVARRDRGPRAQSPQTRRPWRGAVPRGPGVQRGRGHAGGEADAVRR